MVAKNKMNYSHGRNDKPLHRSGQWLNCQKGKNRLCHTTSDEDSRQIRRANWSPPGAARVKPVLAVCSEFALVMLTGGYVSFETNKENS